MISLRQEQLRLVERNFQSYAPEFRMKLASELAAAPIPAGQKAFAELLKQERNPQVLATMVRLLPAIGLEKSDVTGFLQADSQLVRTEALRLYGARKQIDFEKIRGFLDDSAPEIRRLAWKMLASGKADSSLDWKMLEKMQDEPNMEIRALALRAACRLQPRPREVVQWLDRAAGEMPLMRSAAALDPYPEAVLRLSRLAKDSLPAVRIGLCEADHRQFREVFLKLLRDRDLAVRSAACRRLAEYANLTPGEFEQLVSLLGDSSSVVRRAAEPAVEKLLKGHQAEFLPVVRELLGNAGTEPGIRAGLFRIAASMQLRGETALAAAALEDMEAMPELLAAALHFLAAAAPENYAAEKILALAGHRSPLVKAAVAEACGKLKLQGAVPVLKALSQLNQPQPVREAAYLAMGRHPCPEFAGDLLRCLRQVTRTSAVERANAAWAAGHLGKNRENEKMLQQLGRRLVIQCTTAVIPGIAPMFDSMEIIVNGMLSLGVMKKQFGEPYSGMLEQVRTVYDIPLERLGQPGNFMNDMIPRSELTCDVAAQIRKWEAGQKPEPMKIPGSFMEFSLQVVSEDGER